MAHQLILLMRNSFIENFLQNKFYYNLSSQSLSDLNSIINPRKPEKRFTYSEFLHDDDETDDIFTPTANDTPKIPEEPEPEPETEQKVILDEQSKELESETCESEQPEIAAAPEVEPEPEVEIENEFENLNTNGVTIIDDEPKPEPTPEETDFDSFSGLDHTILT